MKECLTLQSLGKWNSKPWDTIFTPSRTARKKTIETSVREDTQKSEPSYTAVRDVKWNSCFKKTAW